MREQELGAGKRVEAVRSSLPMAAATAAEAIALSEAPPRSARPPTALVPPTFTGIPVIARIAGLPADVLESFSHPACTELVRALQAQQDALAVSRAAMVDRIADVLTQFDSAERRFLLKAKRDCYNGRPLAKHRQHAHWPVLSALPGGEADRIVSLEKDLRDTLQSLAVHYDEALVRERRSVVDQAKDRRFLRGVAMGRPGLVEKACRKAPGLDAANYARPQAKWEQSLLRFVTRAAAKLSANSTLTAYALGVVDGKAGAAPFSLSSEPGSETSLVRLDRPSLEQLEVLMLRHPSVRERGLVAWNDTLEEVAPGRYRFVRDSHWRLDAEAQAFTFVKPARITVNLSRELVEQIRAVFRIEDEVRFDTLEKALQEQRGEASGETVRGELDQLLDLGGCFLLAPWPAFEPWLERRMARFLRGLCDRDPSLMTLSKRLDALVEAEAQFAPAERPAQAFAWIETAWGRAVEAALALVGHAGPITTPTHLYEDVIWTPVAGAQKAGAAAQEDRGVVHLGASKAREILEVSDLVGRFAGLFNLRHDILHHVALWWREHAPQHHAMPFVELAQGFAPVWKRFIQFEDAVSQRRNSTDTFEPLAGEALQSLRERRAALIDHVRTLLHDSPTRDRLEVNQLARIVSALPDRYAPILPGSSVFVQPVDERGDSWVLNSLSQGTGRFFSRVTQIMEPELQQRIVDFLVARSTVEVEGEDADLLEVCYPLRSLVRAHHPQAFRVLGIRGVGLGLPAERKVNLRELVVEADLGTERFRLVDAHGRRVLPVQLSTWPKSQIPNVLRLLLAFGPDETRSVYPTGYTERDEALCKWRRLTCGPLTIRRQAWTIEIDALQKELAPLAPFSAYQAIQHWRLGLGLPRVGYYYERTFHGKFKPQYVDFSSPSLCRLFAASVSKIEVGSVHIEEALPGFSNFPFDATGTRRASEVLLDSLTMRRDPDPQARAVAPSSLSVRATGGNVSAGGSVHRNES